MKNKKYEELETNMIHDTIDCFEKFIEFINLEKPILSVKKAMLDKNDCFKLNSMLKKRRDVTAPNYNQFQYPIIDLMFNIALDGKLFVKSDNEKGKLALIKTPNLEQYQSLNEYEKYVYLLQTYWTKYDFEHNIESDYKLTKFIVFLGKMANAKNEKEVSKNISYNICPCYYHLEFFGFGSLILNEKKINNYDNIAIFYPNEFGIKMSSFLIKETSQYINDDNFRFLINISDLTEEIITLKKENPFDVFKNIFPSKDVNKTVNASEVLIDKSGAYLFKVSLKHNKGIWRTISLSHKHTLEDLHLAIQKAFDFDNDHLHAFYINGNSRTGKEIKGYPYGYGMDEDFYDDDELTSDRVTIEDLKLYKGAKIAYVFDFGDNWQFDIALKEINKDAPIPIKPVIVESKGESPDQYAYDGDEW